MRASFSVFALWGLNGFHFSPASAVEWTLSFILIVHLLRITLPEVAEVIGLVWKYYTAAVVAMESFKSRPKEYPPIQTALSPPE
jgi:hypothetical protein